jgi:hypothetical protein
VGFLPIHSLHLRYALAVLQLGPALAQASLDLILFVLHLIAKVIGMYYRVQPFIEMKSHRLFAASQVASIIGLSHCTHLQLSLKSIPHCLRKLKKLYLILNVIKRLLKYFYMFFYVFYMTAQGKHKECSYISTDFTT